MGSQTLGPYLVLLVSFDDIGEWRCESWSLNSENREKGGRDQDMKDKFKGGAAVENVAQHFVYHRFGDSEPCHSRNIMNVRRNVQLWAPHRMWVEYVAMSLQRDYSKLKAIHVNGRNRLPCIRHSQRVQATLHHVVAFEVPMYLLYSTWALSKHESTQG